MASEGDDKDKTQAHFLIQEGAPVGHYRLVKKIGAGGMGEVWRAEDVLLTRDVALKFLPPNMSDNEEFRQRFFREARAAAGLNHPNIITIYEIAEHDGRLYIAMELLEGKSLQDHLNQTPPGFQESLSTITQVCQGLAQAHEQGCLHRDIKPDNIFITRDNQVKLLDFGLALNTLDTRMTHAGTLMGTANYMSPEQGQGLDLDRRSDIFSIGVVLYRLLGGKLPFERSNLPATIHAIVNTQPESILKLNPDLPPEFDQIFAKLLAKKPDDRIGSAAELVDLLQPFMAGTVNLKAVTVSAPVTVSAVKSLGVLYLRNLGSDDDEFLCYGITEDLIVDLTRLGTLRVAPMRKILKYKDSDEEIEEIASQLDVGLILDGSIYKSATAVRVSAQLIDAATGKNLWADRWEKSPDDLPMIKQALAQGISSALNVGTVAIMEAEVGRPEARNPAAYELYLRGKYTFDRKKDAADVEVALGLYRQALTEEATLMAANNGIAQIHIYRGEYAQAITALDRSREEARRSKSRPDELTSLRLMSKACIMQSKWDEAYQLADEARSIAAEINDASGEAAAISEMIEVLQRRSKFDDALKWFERVVEISLHMDDKEALSDAYKNMGNVYFRAGNYEKARELYEQAITIARKRGDLMLQAKCTANIGLTLTHALKLDKALECYEAAIATYDQLGDPAGKAIVLNNVALLYSSEGNYEQAVEMFRQAAAVHEELGNRSDYSLVLSNNARLLAIIGKFDEAIEMARKAQQISKELDYPFVANLAEDSTGYALQCKGDYSESIKHYQAALDVATEAGLRREAALAHMNLGVAHYYLNDLDRAKKEATTAHEIGADLGEQYIDLKAHAYLAAVEVKAGEFEKGVNHLRETLKDDEKFGDPRAIIDVKRLLGSLLIEHGRNEDEKDEGRTTLQEALKLAEEKGVIYERHKIEALLEGGG